MHRNMRPVLIGILLLVVGWGMWCMFFLPRGIEPNHEGFYFSEAWRFAQGDVPFRDSTWSSVTLAFWWESWILRIWPDCTFLGLRIVWAVMMLLSALVTLKLMLRYFSPLVSFTGAAASLLFVSAVTLIKAPSYNSMFFLPLFLAVWLWVIACHRSGKAQLFLAAGAGMAAFLATTCRISLVPVILLPILTIVYDRCFSVKVDGHWRMAITFFVTYLAGVLCFFLAVGSMGLIDDMVYGWTAVESSGAHGLVSLAHRFIFSSLFILLPGSAVILALACFRYRKDLMTFTATHKKDVKLGISIIGFIFIIAIFVSLYLYEWGGMFWAGLLKLNFYARLISDPVHMKLFWLLLVIAMGIVLADVTFHLFDRVFNRKTGENFARTHDRSRLGIIAIFLCLVTILGTNELPSRAIYLNSWLLVSLAVSLSFVWLASFASKRLNKLRFVWLLRGAYIVFVLVFVWWGIRQSCFSARFPWAYESSVWGLNVSPKTERFHGILIGQYRADYIDSLVAAVERNSEAGDRILVYYSKPWLYCSTNRLPSTHITLIQTFLLNKLALHTALEDMIQRDRAPEVVVYNPSIDAPIIEYVEWNYEVVEEVMGVKIMLPNPNATILEPEKLALVEGSTLSCLETVNGRLLAEEGTPIVINAQQGKTISISGWAVDDKAGQAAGGVFINIDGQIDIPASFRTNRQDVADVLENSHYRSSGFWASFATSVIGEGQHTLSLKIVTVDKKGYYKGKQEIILEVR